MFIVVFLLLMFVGTFLSDAIGSNSNLKTIGWVANNIQNSFSALARLITGSAFIAGFGFFCAAILKFKAHKDNPTQVPVGTPIALLFVAIALIFLPSLFSVGGRTLFGNSMTAGGISGVDFVSGSK